MPIGASRSAILPPTRPGYSFVSYDPVLKTRVTVIQSGLGALTPWTITPWHPNSVGPILSSTFTNQTMGSLIWAAANRAIYVPISIYKPVTIYKVFLHNGSVVSGNFDIGLYTEAGTRLFSTGSTAQAGVDTVQSVNITDYALDEGNYFIALALDNVTGRIQGLSESSPKLLAIGVLGQNSAFALPATATFGTVATQMPLFGLAITSYWPG